jgi:hypothetical protein
VIPAICGILRAADQEKIGAKSMQGGVSLCIPEAGNQPTLTPTAGTCSAKYKLTELGAEGKEGKAGKEGAPGKEGKEGKLSGLSEAEIKTLDEVLPYMKFVKEGVDKKPTVKFSGANVQVLSGSVKSRKSMVWGIWSSALTNIPMRRRDRTIS